MESSTDRPGSGPAGDDFFVGVNLPWLTYGCDFGSNGWQPEGGVGAPSRAAPLEETLERLAGSGLRVVRWFLFCDGRAGIRVDSTGAASGLDTLVLRDVDAALASASRHGLALIPVLFDFLWCARRRIVNGVQLGGRRAMLARRGRRASLVEHVVRPLLERYGHEPGIMCWDVFNEPEWAVLGYGSGNPRAAVWPWTMRSLLGGLVSCVHDTASQPATVGLASARGLPLVRGLGVDLYQLHWYDSVAPFVEDVAGRLGKRVMLGEFPTEGSARDAAAILRGARDLGYCGALGWSALALDAHSSLAALERAASAPPLSGEAGEAPRA